MNWLLLTLSLTLLQFCLGQKKIEAKKIKQNIVLDANFQENSWDDANWSSNFTQLKPIPGNKPTKPTQTCHGVLRGDQGPTPPEPNKGVTMPWRGKIRLVEIK